MVIGACAMIFFPCFVKSLDRTNNTPQFWGAVLDFGQFDEMNLSYAVQGDPHNPIF
jgi:hypothetical protein